MNHFFGTIGILNINVFCGAYQRGTQRHGYNFFNRDGNSKNPPLWKRNILFVNGNVYKGKKYWKEECKYRNYCFNF